MANEVNLQKIREKILSDDYGKFDLIEDVLTRQEILYSKPRVVFKSITERLSMPEDKINRKTFWSWLRRYKQNYGTSNPNPVGRQRIPARRSTDFIQSKIEDQDSLQNFKPSIPEGNSHRSVVIKVIRSDSNSQQQ
jgi:hypothetical protein